MINNKHLDRLRAAIPKGSVHALSVHCLPIITVQSLIETAHERNRLQPILIAALEWRGIVNAVASGNPPDNYPERLQTALTKLHAVVEAEVIFKSQG